MPAVLTIGEVARRAGVRASTIRYYEEAGLLEEPERVGGKRRYNEEVLRRLALIGGAKRAGFTLGEVRTLLHGFPAATGAAQPGRRSLRRSWSRWTMLSRNSGRREGCWRRRCVAIVRAWTNARGCYTRRKLAGITIPLDSETPTLFTKKPPRTTARDST